MEILEVLRDIVAFVVVASMAAVLFGGLALVTQMAA